MTQENIREIIKQLKRIKDERKLTVDEIIDLLDRNNRHLARNTIVKIFSDNSEEYGYQEESIRSIADVMLNVYNESETDDTEVKGLKSTIKLQNIIISQLKEHLAASDKVLQEERLSAMRRVDFLRDRIEKQDQRIEQKDRLITIMLMIYLEKLDKVQDSEYGDMIKMYFKATLSDVNDYLKGLKPEEIERADQGGA